MDKHAQLERFHHDFQRQFYISAFMYVVPETITVEDHFPDKNICVTNYN